LLAAAAAAAAAATVVQQNVLVSRPLMLRVFYTGADEVQWRRILPFRISAEI
jgi:hypothetical protein